MSYLHNSVPIKKENAWIFAPKSRGLGEDDKILVCPKVTPSTF
jgi:hypothetical protein